MNNYCFNSFIIDTDIAKPIPNNLTIEVCKTQYQCNKTIAFQSSRLINNIISKNPTSNVVNLDYDDKVHQFDIVAQILMGKEIFLLKSNINFLLDISQYLEISILRKKCLEFKDYLNDIKKLMENDDDFQKLIDLECSIFSLNECSINIVLQELQELQNVKVECRLVMNACLARPNLIPIYLDLIQKINNQIFVKEFLYCLLEPYIKKSAEIYVNLNYEVGFIVRRLIDMNLITFEDVPQFKYYSFFLMDFLIIKFPNIISIFKNIYENRYKLSLSQIEEIQKDDWKLHKELVKSGKNSFDIAIAIRNDDIDFLQQNASNLKFDFNAKIQRSFYESVKFIAKEPSLIQYAAFFGSIQCFKFLLMNGAKCDEELAKFAVASGNAEIIRIVEQKGCPFKDTIEVAFNFNNSSIFDWIRFNKIKENQFSYIELIQKCVHKNHFHFLSSLLEEGYDPNKAKLASAAVEEDNMILLNLLLKIRIIDINIKEGNPLIIACIKKNVDIVKRLLNQKDIDVNPYYRPLYPAPLCIATMNRDIEIVKLLLGHKNIYLNMRNERLQTPLYISCSLNEMELVKLFVAQDSTDLNADTGGNDKVQNIFFFFLLILLLFILL